MSGGGGKDIWLRFLVEGGGGGGGRKELVVFYYFFSKEDRVYLKEERSYVF